MELNDYQQRAMATCMPSCDNFAYMMLNLVGEVGEFAGKVAKAVRHESLRVDENVLCTKDMTIQDYTDALDVELRREAGDILWQLAGLCSAMGWRLEDVATENLRKLADRKRRGVIDGSGDNR